MREEKRFKTFMTRPTRKKRLVVDFAKKKANKIKYLDPKCTHLRVIFSNTFYNKRTK